MAKSSNPHWAGWTPKNDALLLKMKADKMSLRDMAAKLGINYGTVRFRLRRLEDLGVTIEQREQPAQSPTHIERYKAARRGFVVPRHLEAKYFGLLKEGVPIVEACERLGISSNRERGE